MVKLCFGLQQFFFVIISAVKSNTQRSHSMYLNHSISMCLCCFFFFLLGVPNEYISSNHANKESVSSAFVFVRVCFSLLCSIIVEHIANSENVLLFFFFIISMIPFGISCNVYVYTSKTHEQYMKQLHTVLAYYCMFSAFVDSTIIKT